MGKRVVIGLSGGVDSSVAAWLLQRQGYDVVGLFMRNWHDTTGTLSGDCPWEDDQIFAELVARRLDIPFHFVDLSEQYRARVVDYMFAEYAAGRTPNPDVLCNREIKFDVFMREAFRLGADAVATGHYCRVEQTTVGGGVTGDGDTMYRLLAGIDLGKDQSYFLCQLSQDQLSKAMFPIGGLLKSEVRAIAAEQKLATAARKDSQGICFVGKVDLPTFLQQQLEARRGDIVEIPADWSGYGVCENFEGGDESVSLAGSALLAGSVSLDDSAVLADAALLADSAMLEALAVPYIYEPGDGSKVGEHDGAHFYTIGQRKGLSVGGKAEPLFVIATDVVRNVVYVGQGASHPGLFRRALRVRGSELHWIRPDRAVPSGGSERFSFRIRYRQPLQGGVLLRPKTLDSDAYIVFDTPQRGITAGQFAAWYDGDELIGSGVISQ
ncbi:MAG: tRNA 2-thiouridine(34) synthase MnmA [Alistipes sp.]|jgi:tRNA-specific 2-thiouridylase|nr:tRNA 2-thiouridine(34) synthase MnmA [Alistipes sp.]